MSLSQRFNYGDPTKTSNDYIDLKDTGSGTFMTTDCKAQRKFLVNYVDLDSFLDYLLGFATGAFGKIKREPPDAHPDFPTLYCTQAQIQGYGPPGVGTLAGNLGTQYTFPYAIVTAEYGQLDYAVGGLPDYPNNYITRTTQLSSQYITVQGFMNAASRATSSQLQIQPGFQLPSVELVITEWMIPGAQFTIPNIVNIQKAIGCVNDSYFENVPAGCALYTGCVPVVTKPQLHTENGQTPIYTWRLEHHFVLKNNGPSIPGDFLDGGAGWNYILDTVPKATTGSTVTPGWDLLLSNGPWSTAAAATAALTADNMANGKYRLYRGRFHMQSLFS